MRTNCCSNYYNQDKTVKKNGGYTFGNDVGSVRMVEIDQWAYAIPKPEHM